jgi:alpha-tubulin suppressor-like RCC1 family protein
MISGLRITLPTLTFIGSPASQPGIVEDLSNLPDKIVRISSGGAMTAALTSGNDVYFWGVGMSGPLGNLWSASPQPLDLDEQDILDVAVGNEHILILTTEHKVFAIGANGSGQLGLSNKEYREWTEIPLSLKERQQVTRVYTSYNNSFVLVTNSV